MGLTLCVIAVWLCSAAAEMLARGEDAYFTAVAVKYTAIAVTPPLVLLFICHYTERFTIRRGPLALLFLLPLCTIALVWTNPWHQAMWAHPPLGPNGERVMRLAWGPWCRWVHFPVSYAMTGAALWITLGELFSQSKLYRAQTAMLLVAVLIPAVVNVLFTAGFGDARFGPTPVAFALSGVLFAWGFVRLRLFQLSPIAYRSIFDHMRDGVVVVDRYRRVVDVNQVALSLSGRIEPEVIGFRVEEVLPWRDALLAALEAPEAGRAHAAPAADGRSSWSSRRSRAAASAAWARSCCCATSPSATAPTRRCARARPG